MSTPHWSIRTARTIYQDPWLRIRGYEVINPNGGAGHYAILSPKTLAIAVVPIDSDGCVRLVSQPRFATGGYSWELPAGGGDPHLDPLIGAQRELREETGCTASNWQQILHFQMSNSLSDEIAFGFLATGLSEGDATPDEMEHLTPLHLPFAEAMKWATDGRIQHGLTIILLLRVYQMAKDGMLDEDLTALILARSS